MSPASADDDRERALLDLAEEFPLLAMLVERRAGGRHKLPVGRGNGRVLGVPDLFSPGPEIEATAGDTAPPSETAPTTSEQELSPEARTTPQPTAQPTELPGRRGARRPTRLGLRIQFETQPELSTLGRLVETTVWVNDAHPAYRRAAASRSEGYHLALSVALALASVAVEPLREMPSSRSFSRGGASRSIRDRNVDVAADCDASFLTSAAREDTYEEPDSLRGHS